MMIIGEVRTYLVRNHPALTNSTVVWIEGHEFKREDFLTDAEAEARAAELRAARHEEQS